MLVIKQIIPQLTYLFIIIPAVSQRVDKDSSNLVATLRESSLLPRFIREWTQRRQDSLLPSKSHNRSRRLPALDGVQSTGPNSQCVNTKGCGNNSHCVHLSYETNFQ